MSRLPRVTGKEVVSALKRAGFVVNPKPLGWFFWFIF